MRKNRMKQAALFLAAATVVISLAGCQGNGSEKQAAGAGTGTETAKAGTDSGAGTGTAKQPGDVKLSGKLEMVTNADETTYNAVNQILQAFMAKNPGVKITYTTQGSDYEQLMKARMASNDLPDVFATHGWSVARYSKYLRPLNDEPWYKTIDKSFISNIENKDGQIFVLPLTMDQGGLMYNKKLMKDLAIDIPKTWDEFMTDCKLAKEKGLTGVFIAGKDSRQPANLMDIAATTYLASCEDKGYTGQLADGSFDWNNWTPVSKLLLDLKNEGCLNKDCVTCDPVDAVPRMAENNILFLLNSSPDLINQVMEANPEAQYGMAPIPAISGSYEPVFCGGEREAYGVWKGTKNEQACLALLQFMAKPENVKLVCEASGKRSAISGVNPDLGAVAQDYDKYSAAAIYPFFDRVYLPNGMWSTMKTIGSGLIGGDMTVEESVKVMKNDYETLRTQN